MTFREKVFDYLWEYPWAANIAAATVTGFMVLWNIYDKQWAFTVMFLFLTALNLWLVVATYKRTKQRRRDQLFDSL